MKRRPTVLQVLPALVAGGVERGTVDVAAALAAAGWHSLVASAGGPMTRELDRAGAMHFTLPLASKNPFVIHANVGRLAALIRAHEVDIVHARSRAPAWSARAAAQNTGAHFLTTFHNAYGGKSWLKRRYNAVMARGELVIANSNFVADHAAATYGVPRERLRVIHRGVDVTRFDPEKISAERMARLAQEWRLPDGVPVVMLPGRLSRWKGHFVLIDAMKRLNRPQVHALIVGAGGGDGYRARLDSAIAHAGTAVTFRVLDECRDMPAAYMLADVVVSASTEPEGFGRVIVEAQAMG
ncbi:MAG TPA: glycosyltransferase family 4 protein, partial [Stellaceae bacterium]|nr:glycosyltransferase family 4 protein [Stellaceae bacterium]